MGEFLVTLTLTLVTLAPGVQGYSRGAPAEQCDAMWPGHYGANYRTADGSEPYVITVSNSTYSPGQTLQITLKSKPGPSGSQFKGFMLQARRANASGPRLGTFSLQSGSGLQLLSCGNQSGTAVTHTTNISSEGTDSVSASWTAPSSGGGVTGDDVIFLATVVKELTTVYMGLSSTNVSFVAGGGGGGGRTEAQWLSVNIVCFLLSFIVT